MRGGEGEEDEPGGDPQPLSQVSAQQDVHGYNRLLAPAPVAFRI